MSREVEDFIGFAQLPSVISSGNSRHFLHHSASKLINRNMDNRVLPRFRQFACFHFEFLLALHGIFLCSLIGSCDSFGFGWTTLQWKVLLLYHADKVWYNVLQTLSLFFLLIIKIWHCNRCRLGRVFVAASHTYTQTYFFTTAPHHTIAPREHDLKASLLFFAVFWMAIFSPRSPTRPRRYSTT